jgi:hypothetical protein
LCRSPFDPGLPKIVVNPNERSTPRRLLHAPRSSSWLLIGVSDHASERLCNRAAKVARKLQSVFSGSSAIYFARRSLLPTTWSRLSGDGSPSPISRDRVPRVQGGHRGADPAASGRDDPTR